MLNIGPQELLIILVIALVVLGPQRLPELGRSIGRGLREIRKAQDEVKRTIRLNLDEETSNYGTRNRSQDRPSTGSMRSPGDGPGATPPIAGETPPKASEPPPASEVREISQSLGRSLSELRRAKEEVQRSFRVDLSRPTTKPPAPKQPAPKPSTTEGTGPGSDRGAGPDGAAAS
jgi:sec-independent protein translocase protein TatB